MKTKVLNALIATSEGTKYYNNVIKLWKKNAEQGDTGSNDDSIEREVRKQFYMKRFNQESNAYAYKLSLSCIMFKITEFTDEAFPN